MTRHTMTAVALMFGLGVMGSGTALAQTAQEELGATEDQLTTRDYSEQRIHRDDSAAAPTDEFLDIDTDQDEYVSAEEARADYERRFDQYAASPDEGLTEDEWLFGDVGFGDVDEDADMRVTREEFVGYGERAYDEAVAAGTEDQLFTRDYSEQRVFRDDQPAAPTEEFADIDTDQDGYISMDEARADYEQTFSEIDLDQDGVITEEEWGVVRDVELSEVDVDADAQVTREEFMGYGEQRYQEGLGG